MPHQRLAAAAPAHPALAQDPEPNNAPRQNLWVTDGHVYDVKQLGNTLNYVEPATGSACPCPPPRR